MGLDERNYDHLGWCFSKYVSHIETRLSLIDVAYDGIHKGGFLQGGLGALTDTLINRHIQLYPGGITNGKKEEVVFTFFLFFLQQVVGWAGEASLPSHSASA